MRQVKKQQRVRTASKQSEDTRRTVCGLARDESVIINQQRQTIGRARFFETVVNGCVCKYKRTIC